MEKQQLMMQIRKKKLGVLIADARIASHRNNNDCARAMGVSIDEYNDFEQGIAAPSMPQIESLACYLNLPMQHFWGKESKSAEGEWELDTVLQRLAVRSQFMGIRLRQAREEAGLSLQKAQEQTSIHAEDIQKYENGEVILPLPELEAMCKAYNIDISEFYDARGIIGKWHLQQEAAVFFSELPEELRHFISKQVHFPYIEIAMRLSEMPADKLRIIAESLLEITY